MSASKLHYFFALFLTVLCNHLFAGELDQAKAYDKHYPEIKYQDLRKSIDAGEVFIIDVNSEQTYKQGHLPTAVSMVDEKKLEERMPFNKDYPIVVYCGGPQCTAWYKGADFAAARGYNSIRHYKGGLKDWKAQGERLSTTAN
ncbi:rhodanese-like domain-containing protein [Endozoicomonas montiporae]|uniref:Rhodanese-related sulfurtransferase n=1 Tax=Endozoicomonas montiporae CL-33 TaxID=570277 RepID=A0A142BFH8_9GAMM|nr:rhodanese-like domain-containing protein [Endozoicomonas montiporae]AMO57504.1 rhodanese-related sulfurtransferase [Endozoicomonas montiporae CL-33]